MSELVLPAQAGERLSLDNLNDDVLLEICSFVHNIYDKVPDPYHCGSETSTKPKEISASKSLSMVNKHFRRLITPKLFRRLSVGGSWNVSVWLGVVGNSPAMMEYARVFKFKVFTVFGEGPPPMDLDHRLASILAQMQRLENLTLVVPEYYTNGLAEVFNKTKLSLPRVHTLVLGVSCEFVIRHCPNVRTISTSRWTPLQPRRADNGNERRDHAANLIAAAGEAPQLTYFEMDQWWEARRLEAVHKHMPNLKSLGMPGGHYTDGIKAMVPVLSRFTRLEELFLADASVLNVGFNRPWCGNAYTGPYGAETEKRVRKQCQEAREKVVRLVSEACPGVKSLWVGDQAEAAIGRDERGCTTVSWEEGRGRVRAGGW